MVDFEGGHFVYHSPDNITVFSIQPKPARVVVFTSENEYEIESVKSGTRYTLTIPFTCDEKDAVLDQDLL